VVSDNRVSAVLCSTDLDRSQDFYESKVGLRLSPATIKNHLVFECGDGTTLLIYGRPSPNLRSTPRCGSGPPTSRPTCGNWSREESPSTPSSSAT